MGVLHFVRRRHFVASGVAVLPAAWHVCLKATGSSFELCPAEPGRRCQLSFAVAFGSACDSHHARALAKREREIVASATQCPVA